MPRTEPGIRSVWGGATPEGKISKEAGFSFDLGMLENSQSSCAYRGASEWKTHVTHRYQWTVLIPA